MRAQPRYNGAIGVSDIAGEAATGSGRDCWESVERQSKNIGHPACAPDFSVSRFQLFSVLLGTARPSGFGESGETELAMADDDEEKAETLKTHFRFSPFQRLSIFLPSAFPRNDRFNRALRVA
jgi:hypothetical protein